MAATIGIRREDKNAWERRVPLIPEAVGRLVDAGFDVVVQPSPIRAFEDEQYVRAGAVLCEDLEQCGLVLAVKEIPIDLVHGGSTYVFFSHTIKGQAQNMPLLRRFLDTGATLIDYEPVVGPDGRRLVHFGRFAGLAGALDGLWGLGRRLAVEGLHTPLLDLGPAWSYPDLHAGLAAVQTAGRRIRDERRRQPLVIGVVGDGNVARGAHEILDALGAHSVSPAELLAGVSDDHMIYRVTFHEEHTVASDTEEFDVSDYHAHPDRYHSIFAPYLDRLTLLVNAMYWHESAPRLASREDLAHADNSLRLIADLSCDIDGGIQATVRATTPDDPVFVYDPTTGGDASGFEGPGVAVLAVDHLPCELPRDASTSFSNALEPWIPDLARADYGQDLPDLNLPPQWHRAVIAHRGELAPAYSHLHTALDVPDA